MKLYVPGRGEDFSYLLLGPTYPECRDRRWTG
jgi:hypothetical protein